MCNYLWNTEQLMISTEIYNKVYTHCRRIFFITTSHTLISYSPAPLIFSPAPPSLSAVPLGGETTVVSRWTNPSNSNGCEIGLEMSLRVERGEVKIDAALNGVVDGV